MRALEFLKEYTDVKTAQQNIITVVSGLTADNEQDAQLIRQISKRKYCKSIRIQNCWSRTFVSTF